MATLHDCHCCLASPSKKTERVHLTDKPKAIHSLANDTISPTPFVCLFVYCFLDQEDEGVTCVHAKRVGWLTTSHPYQCEQFVAMGLKERTCWAMIPLLHLLCSSILTPFDLRNKTRARRKEADLRTLTADNNN